MLSGFPAISYQKRPSGSTCFLSVFLNTDIFCFVREVTRRTSADRGGQSDSSWAVLRESDSGCGLCVVWVCGLQLTGREEDGRALWVCVCVFMCVRAHVFTLSRVRSRVSVACMAWQESSSFCHSTVLVWKINTHCHHCDMAHPKIIFIHGYVRDLRDLYVRGTQACV